jgi:hypothetical protein
MKYIFKTITFLLVSLIALILVIEFFYPNLSGRRNDLTFWLNKFSYPKSQIIITGDSRVYQGINPLMIEKSLKESTLNFAFSSNSYTQSYLTYITKTFENSSTYILGLSGQSLTQYAGSSNFENYLNYDQNFIKKCLKFVDLAIPKFNLNNLLLTGELISPNPDKTITYIKKGQIATTLLKKNKEQHADKSYNKNYEQHPIDETLIKNLKSFIGSAIKKGKKVYFFNPPTSKEVSLVDSKHYDFNGLKKELEKVGAIFINLEERRIVETFDGDHLSGDDSAKFTKYFIQQLKTVQR